MLKGYWPTMTIRAPHIYPKTERYTNVIGIGFAPAAHVLPTGETVVAVHATLVPLLLKRPIQVFYPETFPILQTATGPKTDRHRTKHKPALLPAFP